MTAILLRMSLHWLMMITNYNVKIRPARPPARAPGHPSDRPGPPQPRPAIPVESAHLGMPAGRPARTSRPPRGTERGSPGVQGAAMSVPARRHEAGEIRRPDGHSIDISSSANHLMQYPPWTVSFDPRASRRPRAPDRDPA